ncbi:MAG TPA: RluA family pseudouridine synthase [Caulobacteraceae bacterium]|jgi:23S rRNA pseudouridine955/2504/2580 synthase|nr:RluA family pseudouridine synthase [Caulobacteraceae bacterium]
MGEVRTVAVDAGEDGVRLDRWLRRRWPHLGQIQIHKLARSGQLRVDGGRAKADTRLKSGQIVRVPPLPDSPPERSETLSSEDIRFAKSLVLYEDEEVLIFNKPAGLAVQGGTKTNRHIDRLLSAWGDGLDRPRLAHRLDRDTSGVLALGKTAKAAAMLSGAFAKRRAEKIYWAIVKGNPKSFTGIIEQPLAKLGRGDRELMTPVEPNDPRAETAVTLYATVSRAGPAAAWLALRPMTGRTHQLRAHMLAIDCPILGDPKYNTAASVAASGPLKLQLHARRLVISHPGGGLIDVVAPLSSEMEAGFARYGFEPSEAGEISFPQPRRHFHGH